MFVHSASSYGQNKFRIGFRSQCHTFGWYIDISLGESGAHEAPYVSLLIRASRPGVGESPGASYTAAPLYIEYLVMEYMILEGFRQHELNI